MMQRRSLVNSPTDVDLADTVSYQLLGADIAGLTINSNGSWSFDPAVSAYQVNLAFGDGTNDAPEITVNYSATDNNDTVSYESKSLSNDQPALIQPIAIKTVTGTNCLATFSAHKQPQLTSRCRSDTVSYHCLAVSSTSNRCWSFDPPTTLVKPVGQLLL